MKFIFLDIEGVLIDHTDPQPEGAGHPACVARLNRLTDQTGAALVVSSTWRSQGLEEITALLRGWGVTGEIGGITDDLSYLDFVTPLGIQRGDEIGQWLDRHPGDETFVILDDDDDMAGLKPYLVQTDGTTGLTDELAARAAALLEGAPA